MIESYNALSVFVDLYPAIHNDVIPAGTELGRAIVNGGNAPYSYEVLRETGQPSSLYHMEDDIIVATNDIPVKDIEKFSIKVTETPMEESTTATVESDNSQEEATAVQLSEEEEIAMERISYADSLEVAPLAAVSSDIQDLFSKQNMVYKITTDINLGGGTLVIPKGTTLDFQGGTFSNGVLSGWVNIKECNYKIFDNVTFAQDSYIPYIKPEYFGAVGDGETDSASAIQEMFNTCINAAKTFTSGEDTYKDLRGTRFLFQGNYVINSSIVITAATYGLNIEGLNLTAGTTFDNVSNSGMLVFTASINTFNMNKCILNGDYKVNDIMQITAGISYSTLDTITIFKYLLDGIKISGGTSDFNRILNCTIYQFEAFDTPMPEGVNISAGTGVNISAGTEFTFNQCKFLPSFGDSISAGSSRVVVSDCSFDSSDLNEDLTAVTLGEDSVVTNCEFIDVALYIKQNSKATNNSFYIYKGDGSKIIAINARDIIRSRGSIVTNNYINFNGTVVEGKLPVSNTAGDAITEGLATIINNNYIGTNAQPPLMSSLMLDSILKLITNNGIIWSDLSQDNKKAIQIGNILIQWGNLSNLNLQEISFIRPFADTNYSLITNWEDPTSSAMVKMVNRFSIGNGLPTSVGFIPSYIAIGISSVTE